MIYQDSAGHPALSDWVIPDEFNKGVIYKAGCRETTVIVQGLAVESSWEGTAGSESQGKQLGAERCQTAFLPPRESTCSESAGRNPRD